MKIRFVINFLLIGFLNLLLISCITPRQAENLDSKTKTKGQILLFDAGSSGTRVYIYEWTKSPNQNIHSIRPGGTSKDPWMMKVNGGIGNFANQPDQIEDYLKPLIAFSKSKQEAKQIPTYFYATEGVRKLDAEAAKRVLTAAEATLKKEPRFAVKNVETITGQREGIYTWITSNLLLGNFHRPNEAQTVGIVELGGASLQIVFETNQASEEQSIPLTLGEKTYNLYAHSYSIGRKDSFAKVVSTDDSVCLQTETSHSHYKQCKAEVVNKLNLDTNPCKGYLGLQGIRQPPLKGEFLGIGNFFYIYSERGLSFDPRKSSALSQEYCDLSFQTLKTRYPTLPFFKNTCFEFVLVESILTGTTLCPGLGFGASNVNFVAKDKIQGVEPTWTIGAALTAVLGTVIRP